VCIVGLVSSMSPPDMDSACSLRAGFFLPVIG
jgi:hypothetical protein